MLRYKEDKEQNRVWRQRIWVSPNGKYHTESVYLGPYWGFAISCPDTCAVGQACQIQISVVNWKGEVETSPTETEAVVDIYFGETLLEENRYAITDTITIDFTPTQAGTYLIVARQKGWNEGVCITTAQE